MKLGINIKARVVLGNRVWLEIKFRLFYLFYFFIFFLSHVNLLFLFQLILSKYVTDLPNFYILGRSVTYFDTNFCNL